MVFRFLWVNKAQTGSRCGAVVTHLAHVGKAHNARLEASSNDCRSKTAVSAQFAGSKSGSLGKLERWSQRISQHVGVG